MLQSQSFDKAIEKLNIDISNRLDDLEEFIIRFKSSKESSTCNLVRFQAVMDNLILLKEQADRLTAYYDHA
jgi:hypothetical protein